MTRASNIVDMLFEVGGQAAGKVEFVNTTLQQAHDFIDSIKNKKLDLEKDLPDFDDNFKSAQALAKMGWTKRDEMPVIEKEDIRKLQARLEKGNLDINKPFAKDTDPGHPFPTGLSGMAAQKFLKNGLKDGSIKDDQINVEIAQVKVKNLIPIQKQIYFVKILTNYQNPGNVFVKLLWKSIRNSQYLLNDLGEILLTWLTKNPGFS